jgi:hypothetical protein
MARSIISLKVVGLLSVILMLQACTPRVEVAMPDKPINININAKIDHEVRIKVERDVEQLFDENSDLF